MISLIRISQRRICFEANANTMTEALDELGIYIGSPEVCPLRECFYIT